MSQLRLYVDNDNNFMVRGVHVTSPFAYVNDATVQATLRDETGSLLAGQGWPLTLAYVEGSNGDYEGTLQDTIVVAAGDEGTLSLVIDGSGLQAEIEFDYVFLERVAADLWTSRRELENMFGLTNVTQWADLENNQDASDVLERINWAVVEATADAKTRLRGGPATNVLNAPRLLRVATTRLAGVLLYESRGVVDTSSDEGTHRLKRHESLANKFFSRVQSGQLRIADLEDELTQVLMVPPVVSDDENDEFIDDAIFAV